MGRYYVAGIPFDSENSLKHYGVKNMEWGKHKFGLDADPRYIKWLKDAGKNIGSFATKAAQAVGSAVNKGANFVTGNQDRANAAAKRSEATFYNRKASTMAGSTKNARPSQWFDKDSGLTGREYSQMIADEQRVNASKAAKANQQANEYERRANNAVIPSVQRAAGNVRDWAGQQAQNAGKAIGTATGNASNWANQQIQNAGKAIGTAAGNAGNWVNQQAQNVGKAIPGAVKNVGDFFSNRDEYQRLNELSKHYNSNTGKWDSEENRKAFYNAQNAYNSHPLTAIPNMARQIGSNISNGPVGDFARGVGEMANQVGSNVKNFVDYNITGEGQRRIADMLMQNPDQVNKIYEHDGSGWKQTNQYTNAEAADRALAEANNTPLGRVSNVANKAAEGAKGFLNSAGKWVSGTANNAKDAVSKAASDATKGASGFLNSAGRWVSNAAGNVKDAAQNAGNTIGEAANNARGGIGGFFDRVGDTVRGAADSVGDWGREAAGNIGGAISGAADNVRDWAGQQAQNVGGAVQNAGNWIGDRARDVGEAVSGAAGKVADVALWPATREDVANAAGNVRDWAGQQAQNVGGFFDRVGDWGREAAKNVGGAISGAAGNVRDWAGQTAGNVGGWIGDRVNDVGGAISGAAGNVRDYLGNKDDARRAAEISDAHYDPFNKTWDSPESEQAFNDAVAAYNNSPQTRLRNATNDVGDWARNTVPGLANQAGQWLGQQAQNVGGAISGAAGNVRDWAGQAAQNVGNFISEIANPHYQLNTQQMMDNYRQYLNDHPENLQSPQHAEWLRDQIRNDPQLRAYYEQNIREQTIPEQTIPEQTIPEQRISNRSEELDMDRLVNDVYPGRYKDFEDYYNYRISDPRWQNYTREDLTDDLIRMGYNKRISHSALNEKPDSVSDAFWAKFTADGGTREDYERDWR